jgi:hypothetical protein
MTKQQKVKQSNRPLKEDPRALRILQKPTESPADALAHMILRPIVQAAATLTAYNKDFGDVAINTLVDDLDAQCKLANNGDLARAETILMAQAQTLDSVFNNLARRPSLNIGEYMNAAYTYLRLALRRPLSVRRATRINSPRVARFDLFAVYFDVLCFYRSRVLILGFGFIFTLDTLTNPAVFFSLAKKGV